MIVQLSVDRLSGLQLAAQALVAQVREKYRFIHVLDPNLHVPQSQLDPLVRLKENYAWTN
jgi:hypothetical protein